MAEDIKKSFVFSDELPPAGPGNEYSLRYRIVSDDGLRFSAWSPIYTVAGQAYSQVEGTLVTSGTSSFVAVWDDEFNRPEYDVFVAYGKDITYRSLTSNVATIVTKNPHGFKVGDLVNVAGTGAATIDGTDLTVASVPNTISLTYAKVTANVANAAATANASVFGSDTATDRSLSNYIYHGTTAVHSYSFIAGPNVTSLDRSAQVVVQVSGIQKELDSALEIFKSTRVTKA
jgi:hypothetical protein